MKKHTLPRPPQIQQLLKLTVDKEIEKDGVGMGVLSDGTAYLTGSGLARMCGVVESTIREMANDWAAEQFKPRGRAIANLLAERGWTGTSLFIPVEVDGSTHHAYPEPVCTAFLEYYAFVVSPPKQEAVKNARILIGSSLKAFVYVQVGYDPSHSVPLAWKQFHDRVSLTYNKVPKGYFCVFKEIANMVVAMIQNGVPVDDKTVPDISAGQHWGKHWSDNEFDKTLGARIKFESCYPDYFPQAASNPHHPWAYPDEGLPEFRRWFIEMYLPEKFPAYIANQVKNRALPPSIGQLAIQAVHSALPQALPSGMKSADFNPMTPKQLGASLQHAIKPKDGK